MLKFLMYDVGLRKQYRPDMIILQVRFVHAHADAQSLYLSIHQSVRSSHIIYVKCDASQSLLLGFQDCSDHVTPHVYTQ